MELFRWTNDYNLGIESIDDDHRSLFKLLNELFDAMKQGKARDIISDVVSRLHHYTKNHFRREEFYFKTTDYPNMQKHKEEHDAFIEKVKHFQDDLQKENLNLTLEVVGFLREWLVNHIMGSDKAYQSHLIKYGIK